MGHPVSGLWIVGCTGKARVEDLLQAALISAPVAWKAHINACWIADNGQIDQA
ncbi:hypothetical protein AL08_08980 [Corynebacterium diphtheriae bv. gravis str. ISS 4746]|nr:hypothetical protein AL07_09220 [Corynebacterium diphtheriae bv. gravis str. ISS 4060]KLN38986.1 hypothetical protein AL08_08980 [Corynebacterium diphtheriae bv. gravis str. ISS 4746]KLN43782.1 hypothetical protein AL09_09025 [Corynebacterium diphtheriae bv. gravis str. ISS 4749]